MAGSLHFYSLIQYRSSTKAIANKASDSDNLRIKTSMHSKFSSAFEKAPVTYVGQK